jgi:hypothetical protein
MGPDRVIVDAIPRCPGATAGVSSLGGGDVCYFVPLGLTVSVRVALEPS